MVRPALDKSISVTDFNEWHWLKAELFEFCQTYGLPKGGSKQDVLNRIAAFLNGDVVDKPAPATRSTSTRTKKSAPQSPTPATIATIAVPETPEPVIESQFEYNKHFREYYDANPDATREQVIAAWAKKHAVSTRGF